MLDSFGQPTGEKQNVLWDAENYGQENPVYTTDDGRYAWDVPEGKWLVKYSKDGYYDADSSKDPAAIDGYIPVLPIQTEINTAIISKEKPVVERVNAYSDEILIKFSQYMQLDTVNRTNVKITQNGNVLSGRLEPVNAEYNYEKTMQFASDFRFVPSDKISGNVSIEISNVKNYNRNAIASKFSSTEPVVVKPEKITIDSNIKLKYGDSKTVTVKVLPGEAANGKKLVVKADSGAILGIEQQTLTLNSKGEATLKLTGSLPGISGITLSLEGSDITAAATVTVLNPLDGKDVIKGDVNDDGKVNGIDSALLARFTSSWEGYAEKIRNMDAADINGDGVVNGADSGILVRYTSGWENVKRYF